MHHEEEDWSTTAWRHSIGELATWPCSSEAGVEGKVGATVRGVKDRAVSSPSSHWAPYDLLAGSAASAARTWSSAAKSWRRSAARVRRGGRVAATLTDVDCRASLLEF